MIVVYFLITLMRKSYRVLRIVEEALMFDKSFKIRVSLGTAALLNLTRIKLLAYPTTAYFMTYSSNGCIANCAFCPQARESKSNLKMLSRISWPTYSFDQVCKALKNEKVKTEIKRICIQTLNYQNLLADLQAIISQIHKLAPEIPISLPVHPIDEDKMKILKELGVERLGIPFDAATPEIFDKIKGKHVKGPYTWEKHMDAVKRAIKILGDGRVSTHLIIGLGETEKEAVNFIQEFSDLNVTIGLFAFTPIRGTKLEKHPPPPIDKYRRVQLARYLIQNKIARRENMNFDEEGKIIDFGITREELNRIIDSGQPFRTSGCPGCNRPFYNESPRGPIYNFPWNPSKEEIKRIRKELQFL